MEHLQENINNTTQQQSIFQEEEEKIIDVFPELGGCGDNQQHVSSNQNGIQSSQKKEKSCQNNCDCKQQSSTTSKTESKKQKKKAVYFQSQLNDQDKEFINKMNLDTQNDTQSLIKQGKICFKCKLRAPNYCNKQDKVCKSCFMDSIVHRFKQALRTNLKIWKDDLNLICISGGSSSMALMDLMHQALFVGTEEVVTHISQKKMFFKVHILYIDEGQAVYGWDDEFHQKQIQMIKDVCEKQYQFTYTIIPIESIFEIEENALDLKLLDEAQKIDLSEELKKDELEHTKFNENFDQVKNQYIEFKNILELRQKFKDLMECLPIESNFREDIIYYFKKLIISNFCLKYNFKKALFGLNSHNIATQLLSQLCKGRGVSIAHQVSFIDDKNFGGRIQFMNPMREFLLKEISLYNYNRKVQIILQYPLCKINQKNAKRKTNAPAFASTDFLIQGFFSRLQDKFNVNTVPTVVRLTNKLKKEEIEIENQNPFLFCPLCLGIRDKINNLLEIGSTIKSVKVNKNDEGKNEFITQTKDEVICYKNENEWFLNDIEQVLCFGCKKLCISSLNRQKFIDLMPQVVKYNGSVIWKHENS